MTINLAVAVNNDRTARAELLRQFPGLEDDETALLDTLEGITDLADQIDAVVSSALEDELMASALKARMTEMKARAERLEHRSEAKRHAALNAMLESGRKKLERPAFTLSATTKAPAVIVTDESAVPSEYMRQPDPPAPKPDKKLIGDALKAGKEVPGCQLSNGGFSLTVRRA